MSSPPSSGLKIQKEYLPPSTSNKVSSDRPFLVCHSVSELLYMKRARINELVYQKLAFAFDGSLLIVTVVVPSSPVTFNPSC
jgi:hypothetical protein